MKYDGNVRWLKSGEMSDVVALDVANFDHPWQQDTMNVLINLRTNVCAVAEDNLGKIVGFVVFEIQGDRFYILKIGVDRNHRKAGHGNALLKFINDRITPKRNKIEIDVRENLALSGHPFFSKNDFKATKINRDFFKVFTIESEEPSNIEDSYNFVKQVVFPAYELQITDEVDTEQFLVGSNTREFL